MAVDSTLFGQSASWEATSFDKDQVDFSKTSARSMDGVLTVKENAKRKNCASAAKSAEKKPGVIHIPIALSEPSAMANSNDSSQVPCLDC